MSKCPDAVDAEAVLVTVMQSVGHKVSLNFTYIASYQTSSLPALVNLTRLNNDSQSPELICKHGPTECMGNKQQLWYPPAVIAHISNHAAFKNIIPAESFHSYLV
jgi:hypothetical protein